MVRSHSPMANRAQDSLFTTLKACACLCVLGGILAALNAPRAPRAALHDALSAELGLTVVAGTLHSERASPLTVRDALFGRRVVFIARDAHGIGDVLRATVRVTPNGRLLGMSWMANLTRSPLGDDTELTAIDGRVAFITRAYGQVQNVTMLVWHEASHARQGVRRRITSMLETGSTEAPVRWDLRLDRPLDAVALRFEGDALIASSAGRRWRMDSATGALDPAEGATLARARVLDKPAVIWTVDTIRDLSFVGPEPITWLEKNVFDARDEWRRFAFKWFGVSPRRHTEEPVAPVAQVIDAHGRVIDTAAQRNDDPFWPPQRVVPALPDPDRGEGVWTPAAPSWVRTSNEPMAPPAFYRTFLRLDRERPYSRVVLLAMDMRQLDLAMQPGVEDPIPLVGPRGDGRIPRRQLPRVVAAFNGAFKTEHGEYGMVVNHRVLLPPRPRAATVAVLDDGRVAMGTWGERDTLPPTLYSLRQNLDPLVADGLENPTRRSLWGFVLGGIETMPTVRSGLCSDAHGHLMYVWGEETTARFLARAMNRAGCVYGMHLDMNPSHALFNFVRVDDPGGRNPQAHGLADGMSGSDDRFVNYSLKDFFYVMLRDPSPPALPTGQWTSRVAQPAPSWMPSVFRADLPEGVRLYSLPAARVSLAVRAGRIEHAQAATALTSFEATREAPVLGVLELGAATSARAVQVDGARAATFTAGGAWLGVCAGQTTIHLEGEAPAGDCDAVEGLALLRAGASVEVPAGAVGGRQLAVATTADGRMLVAEGAVGWAALTAALQGAGARDAIGLSIEGGEIGASFRGEGTTLHDGYPGPVIFMLERPAPDRVLRLEPLLNAP